MNDGGKVQTVLSIYVLTTGTIFLADTNCGDINKSDKNQTCFCNLIGSGCQGTEVKEHFRCSKRTYLCHGSHLVEVRRELVRGVTAETLSGTLDGMRVVWVVGR